MKHRRTAYVILGVLSIESGKSGYDIRKAIESSVGHFWGESYGQIYPALKQLAAEKLIVASPPPPGTRQRRLLYSLTDTGHAALRDWLALPFQNEPPRNEFLLKLFFGREAPPQVSIGHIQELQNRNQQMLANLLKIETLANANPSQNPHMPYWMLTLSLGIALTRSALEWGESALGQLTTLNAAAAQHQPQTMGDSTADKA